MPAYNRGECSRTEIDSTAETDLVQFGTRDWKDNRGVTIFVHSPIGGTIKTYWIDPFTGARRQIDLTVITADTLEVLDYDFRIPLGAVTFTWDAGSIGGSLGQSIGDPGHVVTCEVVTYGG